MKTSFDFTLYQSRCETLGTLMPSSSLLLLQAAPEVIRNRDAHYPYRQDSHFFYLTGFEEPEAILILLKSKEGNLERHLLCRSKNEEREIWEGFRWGPEAAKERFGFNHTSSIETLNEHIKPLLESTEHLYLNLSAFLSPFEVNTPLSLQHNFNALLQRLRRYGHALHIHDAIPFIEALRRTKAPQEIELMRKAAHISAHAHIKAMQATQPGRYEYEIEAVLTQHFLANGSHSPAYSSIVAGGANACVLHYRDNSAPLNDGDILLIDAGCEYAYYASDITRSFPVNGRFSGAQRDLYTLVLNAQETAIQHLKPGLRWEEYQTITLRKVVEGLKDLKLCEGSVDGIIESGDFKRFYMHRAGHWLGLDVHDAGSYFEPSGESIALTPGMLLTVEPGCYVRPDDKVPPAFWNIGIRIEDDVLITESGCEVISAEVPKKISDIEAVMN
ncbi:MAG: aminopeptidase P N-terminal domain-containing protein [Pseudomonadota bacterium]